MVESPTYGKPELSKTEVTDLMKDYINKKSTGDAIKEFSLHWQSDFTPVLIPPDQSGHVAKCETV